jgi:hypothetical protein
MHSPDVDVNDPVAMRLADSILVQLMIGPADSLGAESFDLMVCTNFDPLETSQPAEPSCREHTLFIRHLNAEAIEQAVNDRLRQLEAPTWDELAREVSRLAWWEFEGYTP